MDQNKDDSVLVSRKELLGIISSLHSAISSIDDISRRKIDLNIAVSRLSIIANAELEKTPAQGVPKREVKIELDLDTKK
jgi:hypothetical protein